MPSAGRVADVVAGRETLFRIFVTPDPDFAPRELSARLTLVNGAESTPYFAKQIIQGASTDAQTASTFQIFVPAEQITPETRYSVALVECGTPSGTLRAPRVPETGDSLLGARPTGTLKIAIVPVQASSRLPDTSEATLEVYRAYLMAMFPTTDVQLSVVSSITTSTPIDWSGLLEQIRVKRQNDRPASDVYYYGFLQPTASIQDFCRGGCTAGVGYVGDADYASTRVAVGLAYGDESSAAVMAHEVGHNHGRNHAPCAPGGGISGVDPSYPYNGALTGVWGYDSRMRKLLPPDQSTDIMGYCDKKWISDYTYQGLIDRVAAVNGAQLRIAAPERMANWWVMLASNEGPRWSVPFAEPEAAFGIPEIAEVLGHDGSVIEYTTVFRTEISDIDTSTILVAEPKADWAAIRVLGAPPLAF